MDIYDKHHCSTFYMVCNDSIVVYTLFNTQDVNGSTPTPILFQRSALDPWEV